MLQLAVCEGRGRGRGCLAVDEGLYCRGNVIVDERLLPWRCRER